MSDRDDREFAPSGPVQPARPPAEFAALTARVAAMERLYDALEERVADLEDSLPMDAPPPPKAA